MYINNTSKVNFGFVWNGPWCESKDLKLHADSKIINMSCGKNHIKIIFVLSVLDHTLFYSQHKPNRHNNPLTLKDDFYNF